MNTIGAKYRLTTYGESHGAAVGGIIDGCPPGITIDVEEVQRELNRRRPGQSHITTSRDEKDKVEFLSGIFEGVTTGTPIGFTVKNEEKKSQHYNNLKDIFRPSHADYTYQSKYGHRDHRGGGRQSARETIARVVGGAIAKQVLAQQGIVIKAYVSAIHTINLDKHYSDLNLNNIESNIVRCPDDEIASQMITHLEKIKKSGDSVGGIITCIASGVPVGLGEPVFNKLHADLGHAMLGINAVKGFEYGNGFDCVNLKGSEQNDEFNIQNGEIRTTSNNSGGIQGGISNGEDITMRIAFKPIPTIFKKQNSVNAAKEEIVFAPQGRHDTCVVPRAVPIVEAMAAITLLDHWLQNKK